MLRPSLAALNLRFSILGLFAVVAVFFLLSAHWVLRPSRHGSSLSASPNTDDTPVVVEDAGNNNDTHPISQLVDRAAEDWDTLLHGQAHDLETALNNYRNRRGRHPPPQFDKWFEFAKEHDAVIVEEFFDQIHHDLNPFWAFGPGEIRYQASNMKHRVVVRDHEASVVTEGEHPWVPAWHDLIQSIQDHLPDVIVPLNTMDESRVIVPFEKMKEHAEAERKRRHFADTAFAVQSFTGMGEGDLTPDGKFDPAFQGPAEGESYWDMVSRGCPEDSRGRNVKIPDNISFADPPADFNNYARLSYQGFVFNVTRSQDPCLRPELQRLHGNFIGPVSVSTTHKLIPLFGGSKLSVNNEILLPAAMYWPEGTVWSGGGVTGGNWERKSNTLTWRDSATGGRNKEDTWTGFHRHRFISMVNGTSVGLAETGQSPPANFVLLDHDINAYNLTTIQHGDLAEFLTEHVDAAFVHLVCFPDSGTPHCPYNDAYFSTKPTMTLTDQLRSKYLPDVDGNSFSAHHRNLLFSSSLPIKSTLYTEWHDARLIPWAHYVPMDATYMDIYAIMEYFMGTARTPGHDSVARKIALDGQSWAQKVLRKEDMKVYVYRLLLEYARVCDDQREYLGYIHDVRPRW